jgi:uncharacterized protein (TIGR03067 family)
MIFSLLTACWLTAAPPLQQPDPLLDPEAPMREELKKLQGSWRIEEQETDGKKLSADELKGRTICFSKNGYFLRTTNKLLQIGLLKIDTAKTPKKLNATILKGEHKDDILQGIYELDGDSLKICMDLEGQARPKEFKTEPKSGLTLMICKRVRAKGEDEDLAGTYKSETVEIDGKKSTTDVTIERIGDSYMVTYTRKGNLLFLGVGLRKGNLFALSWLSEGKVGISVYEIEEGPRLVGEFTQLGGPGVLGRETLTRVVKEL